MLDSASVYINMSVKGMVVVMTFSVMAWKSLGLIWKTEALDTTCCEGQDKILSWNFSLEKNETVQNIQWFFNKTEQIAYASESIEFLVSPGYKCRVERKGIMEILLKNVSSLDAGEYTLHPKLATEQTENMQSIFLTVYESPTYQCKPDITVHHENVIFCSTNSCGGIQLSTEWRIRGKSDPVSKESHLKINSSWNAELVFCCLHRPNMQCHNGDLFDFCASTTIFFPEDKTSSEINVDSKCTENSVGLAVGVTVAVCLVTNISSVVVLCWYYRRKLCKLREHQNVNPEEQDNESEENQGMLPVSCPKNLQRSPDHGARALPAASSGRNGQELRLMSSVGSSVNSKKPVPKALESLKRDTPGRASVKSQASKYFDAPSEPIRLYSNPPDEKIEKSSHETEVSTEHVRYDYACSIETDL